MSDPRTLLADYVTNASESAFQELTACYLDLVYSTAVRLLNGDQHRAQDVTQMVFTDLARLAGTLSPAVQLGGWLHRRTCHVALTLIRGERRRQLRERQVSDMNVWHADPGEGFEKIAPVLDEAINELSDRDRAAIMLRFFEHRDLRAIGEALGSNEDAAQKCVSRAVEKLRSHFARRGVTVSAALIISLLTTHAVQAAPAGLAATVATASLTGAAGAGALGLTETLTQSYLMKKTAIVIALAVLTTAIVTPITVAKVRQARANAPATEKSLREGLVLHLSFDHDETGSSRVTDTSGLKNHGRASGVTWTAEGKQGGAYEFTADGNEVVVSNNASLNPQQLTLAAWIKTKTGDHYWRRIFDKSYGQGYALSVAGDWKQTKNYGQACVEIGPGDHSVLSQGRVDDGQWHQVVMTFDGTTELLYVDGRVQGKAHWKQPGQVGATDFNLVIGCNRSNLSSGEDDLGISFRGVIDEPMVWNRALAEKEVAFLYQSQNGTTAGAVVVN